MNPTPPTPPPLRISPPNPPAPSRLKAPSCLSPRFLRSLRTSPETPLPLRSFLTLGLLRDSSASPRLRVEWDPPLACREFPRRKNTDRSAVNPTPPTPPPLRISAPNPPAPSRLKAPSCLSPRFLRSLRTSPETPLPLRSFLTLGLLRDSSASPGQRAPPASNGPRRWPVGNFLAARTPTGPR